MATTRYILSSNGIDHSTLYTSKAKVLETAQAYVWAAQHTAQDTTEQVHHITVRTATTGKIVFDETVTVPAKIDDTCGGTYELCSVASKTGRCTCPKPAPVEPQMATQPLCEGRPGSYGGCAMRTDGIQGVPAPATVVIDGHQHCEAHAQMAPRLGYVPVTDSGTLDTAELNTDDSILCGWCDKTADRKIQIAGQSHPEFACAGHFREYFPYLSNPQMISALCPDVTHGCKHTMAQSEEGYGVACVEYADAQGVQWQYA